MGGGRSNKKKTLIPAQYGLFRKSHTVLLLERGNLGKKWRALSGGREGDNKPQGATSD